MKESKSLSKFGKMQQKILIATSSYNLQFPHGRHGHNGCQAADLYEGLKCLNDLFYICVFPHGNS